MPRKPTGKPIGRPKKIIDQTQFEKLCFLQCTLREFCAFLEVSDKILEQWCKDTYKDEDGNGMNFSDVFKQKRGKGLVALRRAQFNNAIESKNATMQIFLGKQLLGQEDKSTIEVHRPIDDSIKEMEGYYATKQTGDIGLTDG